MNTKNNANLLMFSKAIFSIFWYHWPTSLKTPHYISSPSDPDVFWTQRDVIVVPTFYTQRMCFFSTHEGFVIDNNYFNDLILHTIILHFMKFAWKNKKNNNIYTGTNNEEQQLLKIYLNHFFFFLVIHDHKKI